jgi:hypothetical protein
MRSPGRAKERVFQLLAKLFTVENFFLVSASATCFSVFHIYRRAVENSGTNYIPHRMRHRKRGIPEKKKARDFSDVAQE